MKLAPGDRAPLYIRGGTVIDPSHGLDDPMDVLVVDGTVAELGKANSLEKKAKSLGAERVDPKRPVLFPYTTLFRSARLGADRESARFRLADRVHRAFRRD